VPDTDKGQKTMNKKVILLACLCCMSIVCKAQYLFTNDIKCYLATKVVDRNGRQYDPQPGLRMVFGYLCEVDGTGFIDLGKVICCDNQGNPLASVKSSGGWNVYFDTASSCYYDLVKKDNDGKCIYKWKGPVYNVPGVKSVDDKLIISRNKTTITTVNSKTGETTYYTLRSGNIYVNQLLKLTDDFMYDLF